MKHLLSNNNFIEVLPFSDNHYKVITLDCYEKIGGDAARGTILMLHDDSEEALELITKQETVEIRLGTKDLGVMMTIQGIILSKEHFRKQLKVTFACVPDKDIFTRRGQLSYNDIDAAIDSLWKGKKEIRTSTDLTSDITLNQAGEFDIKYLGTLCTSYKKNTIFALGLEGLLIKDLVDGIDSSGNKEPHWTMVGKGADVLQKEDKYTYTYDDERYMNPEDPWEEMEKKSEIVGVEIFNDQYHMIHPSMKIFRENLHNNQKIYGSGLYNKIQVTNKTQLYPQYRLGDVINYTLPKSEKMPDQVYIIAAVQYHYRMEPNPDGKNGEPFFINYILQSLQEKGVTMNEEDPKET